MLELPNVSCSCFSHLTLHYFLPSWQVFTMMIIPPSLCQLHHHTQRCRRQPLLRVYLSRTRTAPPISIIISILITNTNTNTLIIIIICITVMIIISINQAKMTVCQCRNWPGSPQHNAPLGNRHAWRRTNWFMSMKGASSRLAKRIEIFDWCACLVCFPYVHSNGNVFSMQFGLFRSLSPSNSSELVMRSFSCFRFCCQCAGWA